MILTNVPPPDKRLKEDKFEEWMLNKLPTSVLWEGGLSGINRHYAGYFVSLNSGTSFWYKGWQDCLASIHNTHFDKNERKYLYFPAAWCSVENLTRWLAFIDNHYDIKARYLGIRILDQNDFYNSTRNIKSHIIALDPNPKRNDTLLRTTFIRYLYYQNFDMRLIGPLYHMVETLGMNPYDALMMAHANRWMRDDVNPFITDRLSLVSNYIALYWPRSKDEMWKLFDDFAIEGQINAVFGGLHLTPQTILNISYGYYSYSEVIKVAKGALEETRTTNGFNPLWARISLLYAGLKRGYFVYPQYQVAYERRTQALRNHEWEKALSIHLEYCRAMKPYLNLAVTHKINWDLWAGEYSSTYKQTAYQFCNNI